MSDCLPPDEFGGDQEDFDVGDRVILQGLQKADYLNHRHGVIVSLPGDTGRYTVDTDLFEDHEGGKSLALKPVNVKREPPIVDDSLRRHGSRRRDWCRMGSPLVHDTGSSAVSRSNLHLRH